MGANKARVGKTLRHVDGGLKGERDHRPDAWCDHQPAAERVVTHGVEQALMQQVVLRVHRRMRLEQRRDDHVERLLALDQLAHTLAKAALADDANPQAKVLERAADFGLEIQHLGLQYLACG